MAFAIALKGIDWQIDGALKTAAVAFLIAWAVFSFVLYISIHWDKRRPLMIATQLVVGLGLVAVWTAYLPAPAQSVAVNAPLASNKETESYPFREKPNETVTFIFGTNSIPIKRELLSKEPQTVPLRSTIGPDSYNSISLYLKDGKPFVDVKMLGDGDPYGTGATYQVEVSRNEFVVRPPAWDRNFNSQAFEVVNEYGTPMLQIYYKQPDVIVINGVFRSNRYVVHASDQTGIHVDVPGTPSPPSLKNIFQYPSMKHRGEFAPDWEPFADLAPVMPNREITRPVKR